MRYVVEPYRDRTGFQVRIESETEAEQTLLKHTREILQFTKSRGNLVIDFNLEPIYASTGD